MRAANLFEDIGARPAIRPCGDAWVRVPRTPAFLSRLSDGLAADERVENPATRAAQVNIAVVSRSPELLASVSALLADERTAVRRHEAIDTLHRGSRPDLIMIDRPVLENLFSDIRRVRRGSVTTEIIVLRAHDASDVVRLLDAGADDATMMSDSTYSSRLHAHARRARTRNAQDKTEFADLRFDRDSNRVWCAGQAIPLTSIEAALLRCLFAHAPDVVPSATLAAWVWGALDTRDRRAVIRVYIGYLRDKLRKSEYAIIRSVHGVGYQLSLR